MSDGELKAIIITILTGLEKRIEDISETLTTEIRIKKIQSEMNSAINKFRRTFDAGASGWLSQLSI